MDDGREEIVDRVTTTEALPSPTTESHLVEANGSILIQDLLSKLYDPVRRLAGKQAKEVFNNVRNPYNAKPNEQKVRGWVEDRYYLSDDAHLFRQWDIDDVLKHVLHEFETEFQRHLDQLSADSGAPDKETRQLLVAARNDKHSDKGTRPSYIDDRATARAIVSFFSTAIPRQEDVTQEMIAKLPERRRLYHQFYADFEPPKEGH